MINIEALNKVISKYPEFVIHPISNPDDKGPSPGKKPLITGWQDLKETPKDIMNYVKSGSNVGLVCGKASNTIVIDFDKFDFLDDVFQGADVQTLRGKRTEGRGHIYFKYNPIIKTSHHKELGIDVLSDSGNAVIAPSVHNSGDVYRFNDAEIIEMPDKAIENLNYLFTTETELKQAISKTRSCFRGIFKEYPNSIPNVHGGDGREFMLALSTDLKAVDGVTFRHIRMFAKLIYGKDYDEKRTIQEWNNIDAKKTWKCDTLRSKLPSYIDYNACDKCDKRRDNNDVKAKTSNKIENKDEIKEPEAPQYIKDKAIEILKAGKSIEYLIDAYHTMHVGDTVTGKMILAAIASQSVLNSSGLQPKLSAGSGKGKSHAAKTILHLVPPKYILETSLSGKALYYKEGLQPGTLVYSDDTEPDEDLQATIKKSTTNFQSKTNREISVKVEGEWTTKSFSIPERIVWLLTSVNDTGSIEYLNRQFNLSVDESSTQDDLVWKRMQEKAITGELEYPINDIVLVCREIINEIKKQLFIVRIPYADRIEWNDKENRRNGAQFIDIIKAFAVFDFMNRKRVDDTTIEANIDDFNNALSLYATRAVNQRLKLNDNEQNKLKLMKIGVKYTMTDLQELFSLTQGGIYTLMHGRKDRNGGGLLSKVPALTTEQETEYLGDMDEGNRKSKPKLLYFLTKDFQNMTSYESVAFLRKV